MELVSDHNYTVPGVGIQHYDQRYWSPKWGSSGGAGLDQWSPTVSQSSHQSRAEHRSMR